MSDEIKALLKKISYMGSCKIISPTNLPDKLISGHKLPVDVIEFYRECGGVELFIESEKYIKIVEPEYFLLTNLVMYYEILKHELRWDDPDNISWSWYLIAEGYDGQYISIDLRPDKLGNCYDSFRDNHANPGYSPIIALSFSELLERLIKNDSELHFWKEESFVPYGDAFSDNI